MERDKSMDQKPNEANKLRRKDFLKASLLPVVAGIAAGGSLTGAQGQGERKALDRKPPLTQESLNRLLGELSRGQRSDLRSLATRDWRAALRQEFALTPQQEAMLGAASPEQVNQVQRGLNDALATNKLMSVVPAPAPGPAERTKVTCSVSTDGKSCTFTCSIVFDRNRRVEGTA